MHPTNNNHQHSIIVPHSFRPPLAVHPPHYHPSFPALYSLGQPLYYPGFYLPLPHSEDSQSSILASSHHLTESVTPQHTSVHLLKDPAVKQEPLSATPQPQSHSAQPNEPVKVSPSTRRSKNPTDGEYRPNRPERRVVRKRIHENANRNILPNELHQIVGFLVKRNRSGQLLKRVMARHPSPS